MFRGTRVSPVQALSENGNNSKCIERNVILLILACLCVKLNVSTCKDLFIYGPHKKKVEKGDNSKSIDAIVI